jgi:DNA modification methylase
MSTGRLVSNGKAEANKLLPQDRPAHNWYRFVLSFPPHLVRDYLGRFRIRQKHTVLDPFCGTGTTLVECKKLGVPSIGIEANPMAHFASQVKLDWAVDPRALANDAEKIAEKTLEQLREEGIEDGGLPLLNKACGSPTNGNVLRFLPRETEKLLLGNSISPRPLHKTLVLLDCLRRYGEERYRRHELLALAKALVFSISNLHFGPEVGVGPPKEDAPVVDCWLTEIHAMAHDLRLLAERREVAASVFHADSRRVREFLRSRSVHAVITSPPYPNEKDYTRTTRLESVLLGLIRSKTDLRDLKKKLVRSNTRGVYKGDDDDRLVLDHPEIQRIARAIETRRIELGKTSGFERLYGRVAKLYFGGMKRHLAELRPVLHRGAQLAYVVGDQASYLRVMIRTGHLLADLAQSLGYELIAIELFRERLATATREQLREEVVVLRWPGTPKRAEPAPPKKKVAP